MKPITMMITLALAAAAPASAFAQRDDGGVAAVSPPETAYLAPNAYDPREQTLNRPAWWSHYLDAQKALRAKDFAAAERSAAAATRLAPANPDLHKLLGAAQMGGRDWRGASRTYATLVRLERTDPVGHAGLGVSLAMLGDPKAQAQYAWLAARVAQCDGRCADASRLAALSLTVKTALDSTAAAAK